MSATPVAWTGDKVTLYPRGKKQIYTARFSLNGKSSRQSMYTRKRKVAIKRAIQFEAELVSGSFQPKAAKKQKVTMEFAVKEFIDFQRSEGRRPKSVTKYEGVLRKFREFAGIHGVTALDGVDLQLFDKYRASTAEKLREKTRHTEAGILKQFLGWCTQRGLMGQNPLGSSRFRKPAPVPIGGPTLEQIDQVLAKCSEEWFPVIAVLAFTGMRVGDCRNLLAKDVDFAGNWIHVVSRKDAPTKSGKSRKVPIHPRLRAILEARSKPQGKWFFTAPASRQYPDGLHHINPKLANEYFQVVLQELEIQTGRKQGGFTLHSLRASCQTICINAGIPREVVDIWLDHVSHRPVAGDVYYKLTDEKSQEFMKKVPFGDGKPSANDGQHKE
jgi:integrase